MTETSAQEDVAGPGCGGGHVPRHSTAVPPPRAAAAGNGRVGLMADGEH